MSLFRTICSKWVSQSPIAILFLFFGYDHQNKNICCYLILSPCRHTGFPNLLRIRAYAIIFCLILRDHFGTKNKKYLATLIHTIFETDDRCSSCASNLKLAKKSLFVAYHGTQIMFLMRIRKSYVLIFLGGTLVGGIPLVFVNGGC